VRDKCEIATTRPCELGPDFRQGDGDCGGVLSLPTASISPGRRPAEAGCRSGTDRRSFQATSFPQVPSLRPACAGLPAGKNGVVF